MKIGIDIDDVLVETASTFIDFHNKVYGTNFKIEEANNFGMHNVWGGTKEETIKKFYLFMESDLFKSMAPFEGVINSVTCLANSYKLFAITSRDEMMKEETIHWINNFFGDNISDVFFTNWFSGKGSVKSKTQICEELGIKILIEDRRKTALDCAQEGIKVLLFDKPWNQNCEHENIVRVKNWKEILEKIEELKDKSENKRESIIEEIRKFVEEECRKPTSKYGYAPFEDHFIPMKNYAVKLAIEKGLDSELIEIAAWLHDIGSIIYGRENHHITGAEVAEKKLLELGYPEEKIERIKECILNHRGSVGSFRGSSEEQVIAEADALVNFDNVTGIFEAAFIEGKSRNETKKSVRQKLINKYNQLSEEGKKLIKLKYDAAMLLLN